MNQRDTITNLNWSRIATILGVLGAFWLLATAAGNLMDSRYVKQSAYGRDQAVIDAKLDRLLDVACEGKPESVRACQ